MSRWFGVVAGRPGACLGLGCSSCGVGLLSAGALFCDWVVQYSKIRINAPIPYLVIKKIFFQSHNE